MAELNGNEIRDYVERGPKRRAYSGSRVVNNTRARYIWLADLARGTLNERINRRAGVREEPKPWAFPVGSSTRRHRRRQEIIQHGRD